MKFLAISIILILSSIDSHATDGISAEEKIRAHIERATGFVVTDVVLSRSEAPSAALLSALTIISRTDLVREAHIYTDNNDIVLNCVTITDSEHDLVAVNYCKIYNNVSLGIKELR